MPLPAGNDTAAAWVREVLGFWFGELQPPQWFKKDPALDAAVRARFAGLHANLAVWPPVPDRSAGRALAAIVVLDQFPRNIYRGTPKAFASDPAALELAKTTVAAGLDRGLAPAERLFVYLPFEHAEDASLQVEAVRLIGSLGDAEWTRYAEAHKAIVDRFGRFPHRNEILGRPSTPEEIQFLAQPGSGF